jgi:hypothetical protein
MHDVPRIGSREFARFLGVTALLGLVACSAAGEGAGGPRLLGTGRTEAVPFELTIAAAIDGSDELRVSRDGARWMHRHWDPPQEVKLGSVVWNVREQPFLPNQGPTRFLPDTVDLGTARVIRRQGRDVVSLEVRDAAIVVSFADTPEGSAPYELTIRFDG